MGNCILKGASDKTVLLNVRESLTIPFSAPNWLDLRIGFFLSLTTESDDDVQTGLTENIGLAPTSPAIADNFYIGLKDSSNIMPATTGSTFAGFSSLYSNVGAQLSSSDIGSGTTNANYWRPNNPTALANRTFMLSNGTTAITTEGISPLYLHFPQDNTGAGGYAVLVGMQFLRSSASSKIITVTVKSIGQSADMLYSNTPTTQLMHDTLASWPTNLATIGPFNFIGGDSPVTATGFEGGGGMVPDAFFYYWPFRQSRLRIHCHGFLRAS
jgi:hypothetical protein